MLQLILIHYPSLDLASTVATVIILERNVQLALQLLQVWSVKTDPLFPVSPYSLVSEFEDGSDLLPFLQEFISNLLEANSGLKLEPSQLVPLAIDSLFGYVSQGLETLNVEERDVDWTYMHTIVWKNIKTAVALLKE